MCMVVIVGMMASPIMAQSIVVRLDGTAGHTMHVELSWYLVLRLIVVGIQNITPV